jgi:uncharacterized protein
MFIDINRIGAKGLLLSDKVGMDENLLIETDSYFLDEIEYSVNLTRDGEKVRARGQVKTLLSLRCVSCLDNYEAQVDSTFDIILFPVGLLAEHQQTALNSDEMEYMFFEGEEIDLERVLMEQINLYIPLNPTCSPYCKGMCPNCGKNLNDENCQCENSMTEMSILFDKFKR